jgi:hypothetical protein
MIPVNKQAHVLIPPDCPDNGDKCLINIDSLLGRCLDTLGVESLCEVSALCPLAYILWQWKKARTMRLDLTLILQITLVGNNNNGEEVLVLHLLRSASPSKSKDEEKTYPKNLLMECPNLLERTTRRNRVNQ